MKNLTIKNNLICYTREFLNILNNNYKVESKLTNIEENWYLFFDWKLYLILEAIISSNNILILQVKKLSENWHYISISMHLDEFKKATLYKKPSICDFLYVNNVLNLKKIKYFDKSKEIYEQDSDFYIN